MKTIEIIESGNFITLDVHLLDCYDIIDSRSDISYDLAESYIAHLADNYELPCDTILVNKVFNQKNEVFSHSTMKISEFLEMGDL